MAQIVSDIRVDSADVWGDREPESPQEAILLAPSGHWLSLNLRCPAEKALWVMRQESML